MYLNQADKVEEHLCICLQEIPAYVPDDTFSVIKRCMSAYSKIFCTTDLSTLRICKVSLMLSQGYCQTIIPWQRREVLLPSFSALHLDVTGPGTSLCVANVLSCGVSRLC